MCDQVHVRTYSSCKGIKGRVLAARKKSINTNLERVIKGYFDQALVQINNNHKNKT